MNPAHDSVAATHNSSPMLRWMCEFVWNRTAFLCYILTVTTIASMFARSHWICDLFANLRVQQVLALGFVCSVAAMFRRWKWLGGAVVLLATHAPSLTSAFIGPDQPANAPDLKFMLANVFTTNAQHHLVISEVLREDPDIIAILELSSAMKQRWDAEDMIQAYPYRITAPQDDGNFGIGLYSRLPFLEEQIVPFNVLDIKTISATVDCSGTEYRVIATHPLPPMGARGFSLRNEHLRQLADHISEIRKSGVPLILLGDLNLTPWSPLFHDLESQTNLRRAGRGYGLAPTWYIRPVLPLGLKLDHALISDNLVCTNHKVGNDIGSDHRPVFVEVGMKSQ